MIQEFVDRFMERKDTLAAVFAEKHPESYMDVVRAVVTVLQDGKDYMDPDRIHQIDDGDYQGTLVFVIGCNGYQPFDYWYVRIYYGSCSGCDTLQAISDFYKDGDKPTDKQVADYMTLALHIVQGLKKMGDSEDEG